MSDPATVEAAGAFTTSRNGTGGLHDRAQAAAAAASSQNGHTRSPNADARVLPSTPHLWPDRPMTLEELQGDWQLVASSLPMWRARRNVVAKFHHLDSPSGSSKARYKSSWSYFEIASYQAKTLLHRVAENRRAKKQQKESQVHGKEEDETPDEVTDRKLEQQGEKKTVVSGVLTKDDGRHGCLRYRPDRMTFQKLLGKDIVWEIFGYGSADETDTGQEQQRVDWFAAYAHPLPMLHSFVSIYFRPHLLDDSDTAMVLYEDIIDCLESPSRTPSSSSSVSLNGGERERGRTRTRGGDVQEASAVAANGNGATTDENGTATNGHAANGATSTGQPIKESKEDRRQRKDGELLRYEVKRLAGQVRLVRGV